MQAAGAGERAGAARAAGRSALEQEAVVGAAEQLVLPQRELVAGQQLAAAHGTAETLDVVYTLSRARITRSLLLKPTWHLAHLMPKSLRAQGTGGGVSTGPAAGLACRAATHPGHTRPGRFVAQREAAGTSPRGVPRPGGVRRHAFGVGGRVLPAPGRAGGPPSSSPGPSGRWRSPGSRGPHLT